MMRRRPAALLALLAAAAAENALLSAGEKPSLKIRGVNLGGWLVLEKWIKPSLFSEWDASGDGALLYTRRIGGSSPTRFHCGT